MTDTSNEAQSAPRAKVRAPRRWSIIWLVPLVTIAAAGWIAYKTIAERGPTVTITFETADGLEAGKTKVMYKGLAVGTVKSIGIGEDLSHVIVKAEMIKGATKHLTEGTEFWVVRPEVSLTRISGLGTLVSGAYIAVQPGEGAPTLSFKGQENVPDPDEQGSTFHLHADELGSIKVSAPIYHRGIAVGEVVKYELAQNDARVVIDFIVETKYQDLVRENSVFWNASGVDVNLGNIFDASLRVGSLESLVAGGIAFANPPGASKPAPAETVFALHNSRPAELESQSVEEGLSLILTAEQLTGVKAGDAVTYRQIAVGKIVETRLAKDAQGVELEVSIAPQHVDLVRQNSQFWNASGVKLNLGNILDPSLQVGSLESLVAGGIAFLTPSDDPGPPVKPGHHFALLSEEPKSLGAPATQEAKDFKVALTADSLGGVGEGSPVFYREIQIGQVLTTRLNNEASGVEIELGIASEHANLIRANSVFWNASGVKLNLGDLVDASIDIESFKSLLAGGIALTNPPDAGAQAQPGATYALHPGRPDNLDRAKQTDDALHIVLRSEVQGSVKVDDPILYREVRVGKVTGVGLGEDADYVALQVAIEPEYAPLVRAKTVFWNASGIHASFGLFSGADIDIESLSALLRGGIAFATPKDGGPAAQGGATYTLHSEPKKEWRAWAPHIRLPQETPKEESTAPASSDAPLPAPAKPESAGGAPIANAPTSEPDLTAPAHSAETVDLPAAVSVSGEHLSTSALTEALAKAGFSNIDNIRRSGSIAHADVDWQGEAMALRIDTRTGRIERTD